VETPRFITRRTAIIAAAGGVATPFLARAQNTPLRYAFPEIGPDRGLEYTPSLACTHGTAEQGEGPFYNTATPRRESLLEAGTAGEVLVLTGLVLTADCQPLRGAVLDFWHCDKNGVYDNSGFRFRGHQYTDENGCYRLETIRPGLYPRRTAHIHAKVQGPKTALLTTQIYFPDLPQANSFDHMYRDELLILLRRAADGWHGRFDFVMPTAAGGA